MISILLDARTDSIINISSQLLDFVNDTCGKAFAEIGIGIGSIMLLFVVIYYITSILDGGKFQLKMLFPVFIYFLVCNFFLGIQASLRVYDASYDKTHGVLFYHQTGSFDERRRS
jgi:uncharacterized membrane protein